MHPYQMNGQRIQWNRDERRILASEAFKLMRSEPDLTPKMAVDKAQRRALPKARHRDLKNIANYKIESWVLPLWSEFKRRLEDNAAAAQEPAQQEIGGNQALVNQTQDAPHEPIDAAPEASKPETNGVNIDVGTGRKPLVRWTDEERRIIANKAYELRKGFPDMSPLQAARKAAQYAMPDDRQREINSYGQIEAWFDPMLKQAEINEQLAAHAARMQQERDDAEREARAHEREQAARAEASQKGHEADALNVAVREHMRSIPLEGWLRGFAQRLAREVVAAIGDEIEKALEARVMGAVSAAQTTPTPEEHERLVVPPKTRLSRVTVCGLLNQQEEDVRRAFQGKIDFVFIKTQHEGGNGHGGHGLLERGANSDVVISMTDHSGHDIDSAAKKLRVPFVRLTGKVSNLKLWLSSWLNGEVALKAAA